MTDSVLFRLSRTDLSQSPELTPTQATADLIVTTFGEEATRGRTIASVVVGGSLFRFANIGSTALLGGRVSAPVVRVLSTGAALFSESAGFQFTDRAWRVGLEGADASLLRAGGEQGLLRGTLESMGTFGALRGAGWATRGQNIVFQHGTQALAMVGAHHMTAWAGWSERPEGSLAEQAAQAEVMNLQVMFGMGAFHEVAPGIAAFERSLELTQRTRERVERRPSRAEIFSPYRIMEGERNQGLSQRRFPLLSDSFQQLRLFSVNPLLLMYPAEALMGTALGFVGSFLQRKPAWVSFLGLAALLGGYHGLRHADSATWIGDSILLGSALLSASAFRRRWTRQARENPFLPSESDSRVPLVRPSPEGMVNPAAVDLERPGTVAEVLHPEIAPDGFPQAFRWAKDVQGSIPKGFRFFHNYFDAVAVSMLWGSLTRSAWSRRFVPGFAAKKGIPLDRFVSRAMTGDYTSFNDFFTRRLRDPQFYEGAAPCEGEVVYIGRGSPDQVVTLKGQRISLKALVGEKLAERLPENVAVVVTYLSPRDLHIEGAPEKGVITHVESVPGYAHTVDPALWNEVNYKGQHGAQYLVFNKRDIVAQEKEMPADSQNPVRSITAYIAAANVYSTVIHPSVGEEIQAGQHRQTYNMGSTNVYIVDAYAFDLAHSLHPGQKLIFGETPFLIPRDEIGSE